MRWKRYARREDLGLTPAEFAVLRRLDSVVAENEGSVRASLKNLETFTGTLAGNAERIERIGACAGQVVRVDARDVVFVAGEQQRAAVRRPRRTHPASAFGQTQPTLIAAGDGNVLGGVRTPAVDAVLRMQPPPWRRNSGTTSSAENMAPMAITKVGVPVK